MVDESQEFFKRNRGQYLRGVSFADVNTGMAVGDFGTILKTTTGGVTIIQEKQINEVSKDYLLYQNYPNPFNPSTVISYQLAVGDQVTLKVYDVLGNEIATLVNEEKPAGTYEVSWDA